LSSKEIRIPKSPLFNFEESLWFLDRNLDDCMHCVRNKSARRLAAIQDEIVLLDISDGGTELVATILAGKKADETLVKAYVNEWLDAGRDIRPFYRLLKKDALLASLATDYKGLHMVGIPDLFECVCWCVLGQQINLEFAYRLKRRIVEQYGKSIVHNGDKYFLFPEPEVIMNVPVADLRAMQVTTRKAEYITGIARLFATGALSKQKLEALGDEELMRRELMLVRGIGEWTANYTIMKSLRGMNCVPYGDIGINNALHYFKGISKKNNRKEVEAVFNNFEGWKTYLVYYLWRSLRQPV
jgi:DNA-3-methyladenine glycosylase II